MTITPCANTNLYLQDLYLQDLAAKQSKFEAELTKESEAEQDHSRFRCVVRLLSVAQQTYFGSDSDSYLCKNTKAQMQINNAMLLLDRSFSWKRLQPAKHL